MGHPQTQRNPPPTHPNRAHATAPSHLVPAHLRRDDVVHVVRRVLAHSAVKHAQKRGVIPAKHVRD